MAQEGSCKSQPVTRAITGCRIQPCVIVAVDARRTCTRGCVHLFRGLMISGVLLFHVVSYFLFLSPLLLPTIESIAYRDTIRNSYSSIVELAWKRKRTLTWLMWITINPTQRESIKNGGERKKKTWNNTNKIDLANTKILVAINHYRWREIVCENSHTHGAVRTREREKVERGNSTLEIGKEKDEWGQPWVWLVRWRLFGSATSTPPQKQPVPLRGRGVEWRIIIGCTQGDIVCFSKWMCYFLVRSDLTNGRAWHLITASQRLGSRTPSSI